MLTNIEETCLTTKMTARNKMVKTAYNVIVTTLNG